MRPLFDRRGVSEVRYSHVVVAHLASFLVKWLWHPDCSSLENYLVRHSICSYTDVAGAPLECLCWDCWKLGQLFVKEIFGVLVLWLESGSCRLFHRPVEVLLC